MMIRHTMNIPDNARFTADYCETGSVLEITGDNVFLRFDCICPAKLKELRDVLDAEIAKGARKSCFEKRKEVVIPSVPKELPKESS